MHTYILERRVSEEPDLIALTVEVVAAFVGQNNIRPDDIPSFIASTHAAIAALKDVNGADAQAESTHVPAVSVRKSLASRDHLISLIDGKQYRTLRRHLATHGLTPEEYRARYSLPASYPMVAPSYSEQRSAMAKSLGLGRKPKAASSEAAPSATPRKRRAKAAPETK